MKFNEAAASVLFLYLLAVGMLLWMESLGLIR